MPYSFPSLTKNYTGDILIVDDKPDNLRLLSSILIDQSYKVRRVISGKLALDAVSLNPPDLILLDILMPEVDGFEVCQQLKANPNTAEIPIIFLSALSDTFDKVRAFALGGADYITKPFQMPEVIARVQHQLTISFQRRMLQNLTIKNEEMGQRAEIRSDELLSLLNQLRVEIQERRKAEGKVQQALEREIELGELKSKLIATVSHEFRTPLAIILLLAEALAFRIELSDTEARSHKFEQIQTNINRLTQVLDNFTTFEAASFSQLQPTRLSLDLAKFWEAIIAEWQVKAGEDYSFDFQVQPNFPRQVYFDPKLLREVLGHIFANAIRYSPAGGKVVVELGQDSTNIMIKIQDQGIGIPVAEREQVFSWFHRASNANSIPGTPGVGMGLAIAKQFMLIQGGSIAAIGEQEQGTTILLKLPLLKG